MSALGRAREVTGYGAAWSLLTCHGLQSKLASFLGHRTAWLVSTASVVIFGTVDASAGTPQNIIYPRQREAIVHDTPKVYLVGRSGCCS